MTRLERRLAKLATLEIKLRAKRAELDRWSAVRRELLRELGRASHGPHAQA
jgi:hypothetical protein